MNQAVTQSIKLAHASEQPRTEDQKPLLDWIVSRLKQLAGNIETRSKPLQRSDQSFIDANLLDPNIGPEISRTLRR